MRDTSQSRIAGQRNDTSVLSSEPRISIPPRQVGTLSEQLLAVGIAIELGELSGTTASEQWDAARTLATDFCRRRT